MAMAMVRREFVRAVSSEGAHTETYLDSSSEHEDEDVGMMFWTLDE